MIKFNIDDYMTKVKPITEYVKTDIPTLNEALGGGIRTGNFIVFQAPSGAGKSTFLQRLFFKTLMARKKAAYISLGEQTNDEIFERIVSISAQISYEDFCNLSDEEQKNICKEFLEVNKDLSYLYYTDDLYKNYSLNIPINNSGSSKEITTSDYEQIFKDILKNDIKFIFIDYLGCILPENEDGLYSLLTKKAAEFKNFCTENNVCICTAMQTNRQLLSAIHADNFKPEMVDESYMADSIGPARKCTVGVSIIPVNDYYYFNVFKNRYNGKEPCIKTIIQQKTYRCDEMFDSEHGF